MVLDWTYTQWVSVVLDWTYTQWVSVVLDWTYTQWVSGVRLDLHTVGECGVRLDLHTVGECGFRLDLDLTVGTWQTEYLAYLYRYDIVTVGTWHLSSWTAGKSVRSWFEM